jgi:hypothetical protein
VPRVTKDEAIRERDRWIRLFSRLEAAVSHHKAAKGAFADDADDALWAARDRVLRSAAEREGM